MGDSGVLCGVGTSVHFTLALLIFADLSCYALHELLVSCSSSLEGTCTLASCQLACANMLCFYALQQREAEYEDSVAKEEQPVVSCTI